MAGEKRNYFNVRDELNLMDTGNIKGVASISGTAGKITTFAIGTLSDDLTFASGKELTFTNDGVHASGMGAKTLLDTWSSGSCSWIKVNIGNYSGYIPVMSGNALYP